MLNVRLGFLPAGSAGTPKEECLLINKRKRCPARKDLLEGTLLEDVAYAWYLALGLNLHSLREWLLINTRHF